MKLEEIEKLCSEATLGPWVLESQAYDLGPTAHIILDTAGNLLNLSEDLTLQDAQFIAASRELIPELCKRVRELETENEKLEAKNERLHTVWAAAKVVCIIAERERWEAIKLLREIFKEQEAE